MLPKIIHQIWIPPAPGVQLSEIVKSQCQSWQFYHPEYIYKLWTPPEMFNALIELKYQEVINAATRCILPSQQSDILRLFLLAVYGGIYVDLKLKAEMRFFDQLQNGNYFFEHHPTSTYKPSTETPTRLLNGFLVGKGEVFEEILNSVVQNVKNNMTKVYTATGGGAIKAIVTKNTGDFSEFNVVPVSTWSKWFSIQAGDYNNIKGHWTKKDNKEMYRQCPPLISPFRSKCEVVYNRACEPEIKWHLEHPTDKYIFMTNKLKLVGWAVKKSTALSHLEIHLENQCIYSAPINFQRIEAGKIFFEYCKAENCGFDVTIEITHGITPVILNLVVVDSCSVRTHIGMLQLIPFNLSE